MEPQTRTGRSEWDCAPGGPRARLPLVFALKALDFGDVPTLEEETAVSVTQQKRALRLYSRRETPLAMVPGSTLSYMSALSPDFSRATPAAKSSAPRLVDSPPSPSVSQLSAPTTNRSVPRSTAESERGVPSRAEYRSVLRLLLPTASETEVSVSEVSVGRFRARLERDFSPYTFDALWMGSISVYAKVPNDR